MHKDPEKDGAQVPAGLIETLSKVGLKQLESSVEFYRAQAAAKYPGRSSQSTLPEEEKSQAPDPHLAAAGKRIFS